MRSIPAYVLCLVWALANVQCHVGAERVVTAENGQPQSPPTSRTVTIEVDVKSVDGVPIADVPLSIRLPLDLATKIPRAGTITDAAGRGTCEVSVPLTLDSIGIGLGASAGSHPRAVGLPQGLTARVNELLGSWAFEKAHRIALNPQSSCYSVTITVKPAIAMTGRVLAGAPAAPVNGVGLYVEGYFGWTTVIRSDGRFKLVGVPKATHSRVWVFYGSQYKPLDIPASAADTDIGDVTIPVMSGLTRLRCTLQPRSEDGAVVPPGDAVSFVKQDGSMVYVFVRQGVRPGYEGTEPNLLGGAGEDTSDLIARIPPGTYYLAPSFWIGSESQVTFIRAVRSGHQPPPGSVERVVIGEGEFVQSIDYWAMAEQFLNYTKPLVPLIQPPVP